MKVASLHVHPLKGGAIVDVDGIDVAPIGFAGDRRWMAMWPNGRFASQRNVPALAGVRAVAGGDGSLRLHLGDGRDEEPVRPTAERVEASLWRSDLSLALAPAEHSERLSRAVGVELRLVAFDERSERRTNADWADADVALADGYPVLIATTASLRALNDDIVAGGGEPVPMTRFRPNIVVEGAAAWEEDGWARVRIGEVDFDVVKPCDRCTVTQVNQETATRDGEEPLRTLRRTRFSLDRRVPGVLFAWNAVPLGTGRLGVGDAVEVLERRAPWPVGAPRSADSVAF